MHRIHGSWCTSFFFQSLIFFYFPLKGLAMQKHPYTHFNAEFHTPWALWFSLSSRCKCFYMFCNRSLKCTAQFAHRHKVSTNPISDKLIRTQKHPQWGLLCPQHRNVLHQRNSHHRALGPSPQRLLNGDKPSLIVLQKGLYISWPQPSGNIHTSAHLLSEEAIRCTHPSNPRCKIQLGKGDTLHQRWLRMDVRLGEQKVKM